MMSLTCLKTGEARENEIYGFSYTFHLLQLNFESVAGGRYGCGVVGNHFLHHLSQCASV